VTDPKLALITLLVQLGVAAAVSSALARSRAFKNLLFAENRNVAQTLALIAFVCVPLMLGVWIRVTVPNFLAADIAFETVIILGILLGPLSAMTAGAVLSLPAMLHHEYLTLPFNLAVGAIAGTYGTFVEEDDVWSFSPFIDLSIYRWIRRNIRRPRLDRQVFLLLLIVGMQIGRNWIAELYPHRLFTLDARPWLVRLAIFACPAVVVGIPLKIWDALRIERKLEEQNRLLLEARLDALQRQINPHFLFNTLNSIASLVRFRPELAREMIVKLANILRTLLREGDSFVPLREELAFTDDYLDIEVVRFGPEKLRVEKEIDPETMDVIVPSMMLQPLIENSIKHGLEPRISGGTITLRSRIEGDALVIEVEDDGIGVSPDRQKPQTVAGIVERGGGIGMRNVRERLEVLYGAAGSFEVVSRPGRGTRVILSIPLPAVGVTPFQRLGSAVLRTPAASVSSATTRS
jgi:two-component system LytT family sensor kinase